METTSERLKKTLETKPVKDLKKLERQQVYYKRLIKSGVIQKETYNLKPLSSI